MNKNIFVSIFIIMFASTSFATEHSKDIVPKASHTKTLLALGDSYTIGTSVGINQTFAAQTVNFLARDLHFEDPEFIANNGWTTQDLLDALEKSPPKNKKYDRVTLLIGVNNQFQQLSQTDYATEFEKLLDKAIQYASRNKKHVIVLSIPDYSVTPFAKTKDTAKITKQIDEFNAINQKITIKKGAVYVEITELSRKAKSDESLIAIDGLHFSEKEYGLWAEKIAKAIRSEL